MAAAGLGLLLLTACAASDASDPEPPPIGGEESEDGDAEEADPEPIEEDEPYAVPDEIDEAYAEDVINALLEINTEALKMVLEQTPGEVIPPEAVDRLHAVTAGGRLEFLLETYQAYINEPALTDGFLPPDELSASRFEPDGILHAEPENCILAVGWWDTTEVVQDAPEEPSLFSLSRTDRDVTELERNPTPWQIREISPMLINGKPIPEDRWDDIEFGDELDRTCQSR